MKKIYAVFLSCVLLTTACNNTAKQEKKENKDTSAMQAELPVTIDARIVDNTKDPSCGMPVKAGISDTTRYDNKLYGFCSKECKDNFLKNPTQLVAAAELKK